MKKHTPRILMVEDDLNNHKLFRDAFGRKGFEVMILENADGPLADMVSEFKPDIISMDLMIGKGGFAMERDGFGAIETLKSDSRTRSIPIIVLSNFFEETKVRRAKELGAVDFISVAGQSIVKIPDHYLSYVTKPKKYKPSHPIFRE